MTTVFRTPHVRLVLLAVALVAPASADGWVTSDMGDDLQVARGCARVTRHSQWQRQAVLAALDMEEILAIAGEGNYKLQSAWQYPGSVYHTGDLGMDKYNVKNIALAKQLVQESGYKGEKIVVVNTKEIPVIYALTSVAIPRMREIGLNVEEQVVDWSGFIGRIQQPEYKRHVDHQFVPITRAGSVCLGPS